MSPTTSYDVSVGPGEPRDDLAHLSTDELSTELACRRWKRNEERRKALLGAFPCEVCGQEPAELTTEMVSEHRMAPRDADGRPMLYAPVEMGTVVARDWRTTVTCVAGHTWSRVETKVES